MTTSAPPQGFALLATIRPAAWEALVGIVDNAWQQHPVEPRAVELCRLRIAGILGAEAWGELRSKAAARAGLTEDAIQALPSWPTSELFSATDRAIIAYGEQMLMDADGIDDTTRDDVRAVAGDEGCARLTVAAALFESVARASLMLGFRCPPEPFVDSLGELA